jgi:glycosyltransferase involved in cell wall biosynthesis
MIDRVIWDGRYVGQHGIARFASEVYTRLPSLPPSLKPSRLKPTGVFGSTAAALELRSRRARLLVSPGYAPSLPGRYSQLLTLHDLIHLESAESASRLKRMYYENLVLPVVRKAGLVMTVSEFSRDRIINWTGLAPEQVVNVGNGCSVEFLDADQAASMDWGADEGQFVLFVGNQRPHKNFRLLAESLPFLSTDVRIVTVGLGLDYVARILREAGTEPGRVDVKMAVDDAELTRLYSKAACLAVPSSYEGFGLIALEAMARGTPAAYVCDAVGEVVGGTGVRCRADATPEEFAACLTRAIDLKGKKRAELVTRARAFQWDDVARKVSQTISFIQAAAR